MIACLDDSAEMTAGELVALVSLSAALVATFRWMAWS